MCPQVKTKTKNKCVVDHYRMRIAWTFHMFWQKMTNVHLIINFPDYSLHMFKPAVIMYSDTRVRRLTDYR